MRPVLNAINLTKTYPGTKNKALHNFTLTVNQGEIFALLGESGCGKTTALRVIAGFEYAEKGTIKIKNKTVADEKKFMEPSNRGIGIVFQDYALFPNKTVLENIQFGLIKKTKEEKQQSIKNMINLTGLNGYEYRYPHQLSGGQQQRVALARALAPKPEILLLDEPFSNIDSLQKNIIREEVRKILKKAGTTAIFVTHDTKDVMAIADKVVVMREGIILQEGTPEQIYNHPKNTYLANFFGNTNIIAATINENIAETPLGKLKIEKSRLLSEVPNKKEIKISIRPNAIKLINTADQNSIPVTIIDSIFMGEYQEVIVQTNIPGETSILLHVHIPPSQITDYNKAYIRVLNEQIAILGE